MVSILCLFRIMYTLCVLYLSVLQWMAVTLAESLYNMPLGGWYLIASLLATYCLVVGLKLIVFKVCNYILQVALPRLFEALYNATLGFLFKPTTRIFLFKAGWSIAYALYTLATVARIFIVESCKHVVWPCIKTTTNFCVFTLIPWSMFLSTMMLCQTIWNMLWLAGKTYALMVWWLFLPINLATERDDYYPAILQHWFTLPCRCVNALMLHHDTFFMGVRGLLTWLLFPLEERFSPPNNFPVGEHGYSQHWDYSENRNDRSWLNWFCIIRLYADPNNEGSYTVPVPDLYDTQNEIFDWETYELNCDTSKHEQSGSYSFDSRHSFDSDESITSESTLLPLDLSEKDNLAWEYSNDEMEPTERGWGAWLSIFKF